MSATDELRRLLDELGVEWWNASPRKTKWNSPVLGGPVAVSEWNGKMVLDAGYVNVTPEQAIAATLGRGTCHDIGYRMDSTRFKCSQCGWDGWVRHAKDGRDYKPLWCPLCGAKVVDE